MRHLLFHFSEGSTNDEKGDFFERFVAELLRPLRLRVERRLRFTGIEIDILARGIDHPQLILVECKAQRDAVSADAISKLLGNVTVRHADAGWLFSTSDLTKDGRGMWDEIQSDPDLGRKFTWYSPERVIDILIDQRTVVEPPAPLLGRLDLQGGNATLVCSATGHHWLVEVLQGGLPAYYCVFDAATGRTVPVADAKAVATASERFTSLEYYETHSSSKRRESSTSQAPVARVVAGDVWADLRPARPMDFVGRDDVIGDALSLLEAIRDGTTSTRTFAVQGPSGWGKSSLVLKLSDLANRRRRLARCSLTAVDTRSATNAGFVSGALRLAFKDAAASGLVPESIDYAISSLTHPLDSPDLLRGVSDLSSGKGVIVLVFDQFEELFTKESLFETFNAIRELSLDLDSKQIPVALGFAWKTDISLPQEHPAYHLWHELAGRRKDLVVRQFGTRDIARVISRAERETGMRLLSALRGRLSEQCQGYPWLLKKLLVHVGRRLSTASSQYALLERELDVEVLFKEDLAGLKAEQLRCLKHVAQRAPAYVSEIEEQFTVDVTNSLLSKGLLVRSGLNYVVYWDIFRDYLTEGRVPQIPWARTFQRDPRSAVRAAQEVRTAGTVSTGDVAKRLGGTEGSWINSLSDLVALQIVDRVADDQYRLAPHIKSAAAADLARHTNAQLSRHVMCRELAFHDRETPVSVGDLEVIVRKMKPGVVLSETVVHQYAMNLKRWLLFAGHLEERGSSIFRPLTVGAQMGQLNTPRSRRRRFLGTSTPVALMDLLRRLRKEGKPVRDAVLQRMGLRNAGYDAVALGLVTRAEGCTVLMVTGGLEKAAKAAVRQQSTLQVVSQALATDSTMSNSALGAALSAETKERWKAGSAKRYANGLRQFHSWVTAGGGTEAGIGRKPAVERG